MSALFVVLVPAVVSPSNRKGTVSLVAFSVGSSLAIWMSFAFFPDGPLPWAELITAHLFGLFVMLYFLYWSRSTN